jgi:hypothetical protein
MSWRPIKRIAVSFLGTAILFSVVVSAGTSLVLLVSSSLGYLPYSDRPGPGWWGHPHWPSLAEAATYFGFAPFLAYFCLFFGLGLFALALVFGLASTSRWLTRVLGAILAGGAALLAVSAAGWYFAVASIGPDTAGILGLLYGAFLFPRFVHVRSDPLPAWMRIVLVSASSGLFAYWLVLPFLPHTPAPPISYDLIRLTPGNQSITAPEWQGQDVARELTALNLHGQVHGGIGGTGASSHDAPEIHVELVALEPITSEARLPIPKQGYVVYTLQNGKWTAHPSIEKTDKHTLILQPGTDPKYDGGRVQITGGKQFAFTWYPAIQTGN